MLILRKTQTESALSCSAWPASVCSRWCSWGRWGWRRVRGRSSTPRSRWCTRWCSSCSTSALSVELSWSENTVANINHRTKCICKFSSLHLWTRLYKNLIFLSAPDDIHIHKQWSPCNKLQFQPQKTCPHWWGWLLPELEECNTKQISWLGCWREAWKQRTLSWRVWKIILCCCTWL